MSRKIILTPYEWLEFEQFHNVFNIYLTNENSKFIDIPHIVLSSVVMAGVDKIYSDWSFYTDTKLFRKATSKISTDKYFAWYMKVYDTFKNYISDAEKLEKLRAIHVLSQLLYCVETNSAALFASGFESVLKLDELPSELSVPLKILSSTIQSKDAQLPILKRDIEKKQIKKLFDVYESKAFTYYKEAQSEIENNFKLTNKTISRIENAGKDLLRNNRDLFFITDNLIKAVPLTAKLIDLFFGKLPGILSNYASSIAVDYLNSSKSVPVYTCEEILKVELIKRMELHLNRNGA